MGRLDAGCVVHGKRDTRCDRGSPGAAIASRAHDASSFLLFALALGRVAGRRTVRVVVVVALAPRRAHTRGGVPVADPGVPGAPQEPSTYQQTLDEALSETFPASDPISPSQAMRAQEEAPSERDPVDWRVERGP
jgi:hypothetical protein